MDNVQEKTCNLCGISKCLTDFHKVKQLKFGRASRCRMCANKAARDKKQTPEAKEKNYAAVRAWVEKNKEYVLEYQKAYRQRNPQKSRAYSRNKYQKNKNNPAWVLNRRMRVGVWRSLKANKDSSWYATLGYELPELQAHLERQFHDGMSWENMGKWHIDHIIPLASFSFSSQDDEKFKRAWALSNLRPLWAEDNLSKGAKQDFLL